MYNISEVIKLILIVVKFKNIPACSGYKYEIPPNRPHPFY